MNLNDWSVVDVDDFPSGTVLAVPIMTGVAEMVQAEALIHGADRAVFLHAVIGAGLAIIRSTGPSTPEPTFPEATEVNQ